MAAVLDTHAAIWYLLDAKSLSPTAFLLVEVVYHVERGRLPTDALDRLLGELKQERPAFRIAPLDSGIAETVKRVFPTCPIALSRPRRFTSGCLS